MQETDEVITPNITLPGVKGRFNVRVNEGNLMVSYEAPIDGNSELFEYSSQNKRKDTPNIGYKRVEDFNALDLMGRTRFVIRDNLPEILACADLSNATFETGGLQSMLQTYIAKNGAWFEYSKRPDQGQSLPCTNALLIEGIQGEDDEVYVGGPSGTHGDENFQTTTIDDIEGHFSVQTGPNEDPKMLFVAYNAPTAYFSELMVARLPDLAVVRYAGPPQYTLPQEGESQTIFPETNPLVIRNNIEQILKESGLEIPSIFEREFIPDMLEMNMDERLKANKGKYDPMPEVKGFKDK